MVFAEIMGVIQATTRQAGHSPLTKVEYLKLNSRITPTFQFAAHRTGVYELYATYEQRRFKHGEWDEVDFGIELRKMLDQDARLAKKVKHFVTEAIH